MFVIKPISHSLSILNRSVKNKYIVVVEDFQAVHSENAEGKHTSGWGGGSRWRGGGRLINICFMSVATGR